MEDKVFVTKYHKTDIRKYIKDGFLSIRFGNFGEYILSGEDLTEGCEYFHSEDLIPEINLNDKPIIIDTKNKDYYKMVSHREVILYCSSERNGRSDIVKNIRKRNGEFFNFVFYFDKSNVILFNELLAKSLERESGLYGKLVVGSTNVKYVDKTKLDGTPFYKRDISPYVEEREIRHLPMWRDSMENHDNGDIKTFQTLLNSKPIFVKIPIQKWMKFGEIKNNKIEDISDKYN